jgi:hypothetical protein
MSNWLKPLVFGIWGLLLTPLIGTTVEKWLAESVFSNPNTVATAIADNLVAISQLRWFKFALVLMTGVAIGVSLESFSNKSGERRAFELRSLGYKFRRLSEIIKIRTESSGWPENALDLRPAIMSAFISARKFDLWTPSDRVFDLPDGSFLSEYFRSVGKLLEDGHLVEATHEALSWKPFLDRGRSS